MKSEDTEKNKSSNKTYIGGQAVLEGVMMRGKSMYAVSVRNADKEIETKKVKLKTKFNNKFFRLPIIRGVVAFVQSLIMGVKIINDSAEMAGLDDLEEENPSKFDKWLMDKFGDKLYDYIMIISVVLAIILGIGLFMVLPVFLASFVTPLLGGRSWAIGAIEGVVRMLIFLAYIVLISRMKEIKRVFMYHGAEHKTINCFESSDELTVENVRKHSRLHKRCGTSFLLLVMLVSIVVFFFVRTEVYWLRLVSRIALVPFIAGLSYEVLKWAGTSDSLFVKVVSYPGLKLQNITTFEPDDSQIEVAIAALEGVLEDEPEHAERSS